MVDQKMQTPRQHWMQVLARAGKELENFEATIRQVPYELVRQAEVGMVMAKGITGGNGQVFNVGEVAATRCVVRLHTGEMGFSYLVGRHLRHAETAAVLDALLQTDEQDYWQKNVIDRLHDEQQQRRRKREHEVMGSKVNFFTMVRGD